MCDFIDVFVAQVPAGLPPVGEVRPETLEGLRMRPGLAMSQVSEVETTMWMLSLVCIDCCAVRPPCSSLAGHQPRASEAHDNTLRTLYARVCGTHHLYLLVPRVIRSTSMSVCVSYMPASCRLSHQISNRGNHYLVSTLHSSPHYDTPPPNTARPHATSPHLHPSLFRITQTNE